MSKIVKYTIKLEISVIENSINDSDLNALTKGCKGWYFFKQFFKIKNFNREVLLNEN